MIDKKLSSASANVSETSKRTLEWDGSLSLCGLISRLHHGDVRLLTDRLTDLDPN